MDSNAETAIESVVSDDDLCSDGVESTDSDGFPRGNDDDQTAVNYRRQVLQETVDEKLKILNERQAYVVAAGSDALECLKDGSASNKLRCIVQGKAGTGKSMVIALLSALTKLKLYDSQHPVLRAAPTGIAAYNIKGQTIHNLFAIKTNNHSPNFIENLSDSSRQKLKTDFRDVQLLIVDEISMVGVRMLQQIDDLQEQHGELQRLGSIYSSMP